MTNPTNTTTENYEEAKLQPDEEEAINYTKGIKEFWSSVLVYVILAIAFAFAGFREPKVLWVFGGLGIGLLVQGLMAYEVIRLRGRTTKKGSSRSGSVARCSRKAVVQGPRKARARPRAFCIRCIVVSYGDERVYKRSVRSPAPVVRLLRASPIPAFRSLLSPSPVAR